MAELAENVSATSKYWEVDTLPAPTEFVQVDSEIVRVQSDFPDGLDYRTKQPRAAKLRVSRGEAGTTAATHTSGTTLMPLYGLGGGGGGLTVDNQSDPPAEVTTLIAPGATLDEGSATLLTSEVQLKRADAVVAFDTPDIATGIELFTLPAGSLIVQLGIYVIAEINAGTISLNFNDTAGFSDAGISGGYGIGGVVPGDVHMDGLFWTSSFGPVELAVETDIILKRTAGDAWTQGSVRVICIYSEASAA